MNVIKSRRNMYRYLKCLCIEKASIIRNALQEIQLIELCSIYSRYRKERVVAGNNKTLSDINQVNQIITRTLIFTVHKFEAQSQFEVTHVQPLQHTNITVQVNKPAPLIIAASLPTWFYRRKSRLPRWNLYA